MHGYIRTGRAHRPAAGMLAAVAAATILSGCSAGSFVMQDTIRTEFRSPDIRPQRFAMLAVVPADRTNRFDYDISDRAAWLLYKDGWAVGWPEEGAVLETEAGVARVCSDSEPYNFEGVVFVTWHRIALWDCATRSLAYDIEGGYAGVDAMTAQLADYLRGEPPPVP